MSGTCGPTSGTQFATYDPESRSWKTWPAIGLWGSIEFSETWPRTGYMRDGSAFELPTSAPPTAASESSSLLPTARKSGGKGAGGPHGTGGPDLRHMVENLLPTPAVNDMGAGKSIEAWDEWTEKMRARHSNGNGHGKSLEIEAKRLLPTPRHTDHHDSLTAPAARRHVEDGNGTLPETIGYSLMPTPSVADSTGGHMTRSGSRSSELLLPGVAKSLLPTPRASDAEKGGPNQRGSRGDLMSTSAVHRTGAATSPPSDDGSESPDDTLPGL